MNTAKINGKFAAMAEDYFQDIDPASILGRLIAASKTGEDCDLEFIQAGLDYFSGDVQNHQVRVFEDRQNKSSKIPKKLKNLLHDAQQGTFNLQIPGLKLPKGTPSTWKFKDVASIKVPGGKDQFTAMRLPKLFDTVGELPVQEIRKIWESRNSAGDSLLLCDKTLAVCLRWHLRGMSIDLAVRKTRTDLEVSRNATKSRQGSNCG